MYLHKLSDYSKLSNKRVYKIFAVNDFEAMVS